MVKIGQNWAKNDVFASLVFTKFAYDERHNPNSYPHIPYLDKLYSSIFMGINLICQKYKSTVTKTSSGSSTTSQHKDKGQHSRSTL